MSYKKNTVGLHKTPNSMKKHFIYCVFLSILAVGTFTFTACGDKSGSSSGQSDSDEAEEEEIEYYVSKDGQFKANFWGATPELSSQMVPTEAGDIEMFSYMYEKSATEAFMIAYGDYPSSLIEGNDPYVLIEGARDGALETCTIESNKKLKVNGFPALRTYAIDEIQNYYYVYEVVLAKNRLYQVMALRDGSYPDDATVEEFLDGFVITMKE